MNKITKATIISIFLILNALLSTNLNFYVLISGSELEIKDLKKAYLEGKGDMDIIMDHTPFACVPDEPRLIEIIQVEISFERSLVIKTLYCCAQSNKYVSEND